MARRCSWGTSTAPPRRRHRGFLAYDTNYFVRECREQPSSSRSLPAGRRSTSREPASFGAAVQGTFRLPQSLGVQSLDHPPLRSPASSRSGTPRTPIARSGSCSGGTPAWLSARPMDYGGAVGSRAGLPGLMASIWTVFDEGFDGIVNGHRDQQVTGAMASAVTASTSTTCRGAPRERSGPACLIGASSRAPVLATPRSSWPQS